MEEVTKKSFIFRGGDIVMDDLTRQFQHMMGIGFIYDEEEEQEEIKYEEEQNYKAFKEATYLKCPRREKKRNVWYLYVLRLEEEKIYIGITNNPRKRIMKHYDGEGAQATKLFKPVEILDVIESANSREIVEQIENDVTQNMIEKYGKENVFGGYLVKTK